MAKRTTSRRAPTRAGKNAKSDKPVSKAFPLIGRNDLNSLLSQAAIYQHRASTANGSLGELIRGYVKKKHDRRDPGKPAH